MRLTLLGLRLFLRRLLLDDLPLGNFLFLRGHNECGEEVKLILFYA